MKVRCVGCHEHMTWREYERNNVHVCLILWKPLSGHWTSVPDYTGKVPGRFMYKEAKDPQWMRDNSFEDCASCSLCVYDVEERLNAEAAAAGARVCTEQELDAAARDAERKKRDAARKEVEALLVAMKVATEDVNVQIQGLEDLARLVCPFGRDGRNDDDEIWQTALNAGAPDVIESAVLVIVSDPGTDTSSHDFTSSSGGGGGGSGSSENLLDAVSKRCCGLWGSAVTAMFDMLTDEVKAQLPAKVPARSRSKRMAPALACGPGQFGVSHGLIEVSARKAGSSDPKLPPAKKGRVSLDVDELDGLKCMACAERRPPEEFSRSQLQKGEGQRRCIACIPTVQLPPQMMQLMMQLDGAEVIDRLRAAEGNEALLLGNERHPELAVGVSCGLLPDVYRCVRFTATELKVASQAGGVDAVLSVMRAHPTNSWMQIEGLMALESLIFSDHRKTKQLLQMLDENRKKAVEGGVADVIESAVMAIVRDDPDDGAGRNCCEELTGASAEARRCHLGRAPQLYQLLTPKSNWAGLGFDLVATAGHTCAVRTMPAVIYDGSHQVTSSVVARDGVSHSAWEAGHAQVGSLRERMKAKKALAQARRRQQG